MIRGIHHVSLHARNYEEMLGFYTEVLGFEVATNISWKDNPLIDEIIGLKRSVARLAMLKTGNSYLELFDYSEPRSNGGEPLRPQDHGYTHICLDVIDIEAEYDRLTAAGMFFFRRPADFGNVKAVYGKDPEGNIIEIQETAPGNAMELGELKLICF